MPYRPHTLASFRGVLGATVASAVEGWSFGIRFGAEDSAVGGGPVPTQNLADSFLATASALIVDAAMRFQSTTWLQECRLYSIGADGRATAEVTIADQAGVKGIFGSGHLPWQNSMVVTLQADGLGKGKYGRIYLPPQAQEITADGGVNSTIIASQTLRLGTFFSALADDANMPVQYLPVVVGRTGVSGTLRTVRHIKVGRVMDTQRRRRRSLDETRIEATLYSEASAVGV